MSVEKLIKMPSINFLHLLSIMKTLLPLFIFFLASNSFAQTNLDFEKWGINYDGIDEAKYWTNMSNATKYGAPANMFKDVANPNSGLACIKLTTVYWEAGTDYSLDTLVGSLVQQVDYTKRPTSFEFSFKSSPKLGDEVLIGIQLTKSVNDSMVVVGEGFFTTNEIQNNWMTKKVDIEYYSGQSPEAISIIALSSANATIIDGTNGYAKIGSTLYLDNLKLNTNKENELLSDYYFHVFPNPAKSFINVETNSPVNQHIEILNLSGILLLNSSFSKQSKIDISSLSSGTYLYKVLNSISGKVTATNKFSIIR